MAALTKNWRPRESVLVRFVDDPILLHERVLLERENGDEWKVVTPDREIQAIDFNSDELEEVMEFTRRRKFPFSSAVRVQSYPMEDAEAGVPSAFELDELVGRARSTGSPPDTGRRLRMKSRPRDEQREKEEEAAREVSTEDIWLSMEYVRDEIDIDDAVTITRRDCTMGGRALHAFPSGRVISARRALAPWTPAPAKSPPPAAGGPGIITADDARVLSPVIYDNKGNRWRDIGDAIRVMSR